MWSMLEDSLVSCHKIRAVNFRQPRGKVINKCEEPAHNAYTGSVETEATVAATNRKRILQQLLILHGKQGRDQQRKELREALCQDTLGEWAAWGRLPLGKETLETLVSKAQELQEETRLSATPGRSAGELGSRERLRGPCTICSNT